MPAFGFDVELDAAAGIWDIASATASSSATCAAR
jgi:hypothetical protein